MTNRPSDGRETTIPFGGNMSGDPPRVPKPKIVVNDKTGIALATGLSHPSFH